MNYNFKDIDVGNLISQRVNEKNIEISRICNFFKCSDIEVNNMMARESLETELLLKWSKLLQYDFFRIYSQHLILYSPPTGNFDMKIASNLPQFRKNIYTKEIIEFIINLYITGMKTKRDIIEDYNIPKTTILRWIEKYGRNTDLLSKINHENIIK